MIKYSPQSAQALGFLKKQFNDIEIYIEDIAHHNAFIILFKSILGPGVKLRSLIGLGGRQAVIEACKLDQVDDKRKKIYVIDGDLDLISKKPKPKLRYLYRIRAYCIENILISEAAITEIGIDTLPKEDLEEVKNRIGFNLWMSSVSEKLFPLFVLYAVAYKLKLELETVCVPVSTLYKRERAVVILDEDKIKIRKLHVIRNLLKNCNKNKVRLMIKDFYDSAIDFKPSVEYLISGKDYILPYLLIHLTSAIRFHGNQDQLKIRLARHYDSRREPYLARRLREALKA